MICAEFHHNKVHSVDITATSFFFVLSFRCACQVIIKANSSLAPTELIGRIKSKIHGNSMHGNFTQDQLTLLVNSEHVTVKKLGNCVWGIFPYAFTFLYYKARNAHTVRDPEFRGGGKWSSCSFSHPQYPLALTSFLPLRTY